MRCATLAVGLLIALSFASMAQADTITSADFSIRFGSAVGGAATWTTTENAGTNSPTTQGDFTFSPTVSGASWSGSGPLFTNQTLSDGSTGVGLCAILADAFSVPIVASYNGAAPANASATPNYQLTLEITNISIYGLQDSSRGGATYAATMAWDEVTPGHTATSPSVAINRFTTVADRSWMYMAAKYTQNAWDPDDYSMSLGALTDSSTRTFDILTRGADDYRVADGLVIQGRVILSYDAAIVPEPSTFILLATGLMGLLCYAWRKRK